MAVTVERVEWVHVGEVGYPETRRVEFPKHKDVYTEELADGTVITYEVPGHVLGKDRATFLKRRRWCALRKAGLSPVVERYWVLRKGEERPREVVTIMAGGWGRRGHRSAPWLTSEAALRRFLEACRQDPKLEVRERPLGRVQPNPKAYESRYEN